MLQALVDIKENLLKQWFPGHGLILLNYLIQTMPKNDDRLLKGPLFSNIKAATDQKHCRSKVWLYNIFDRSLKLTKTAFIWLKAQ